MDRNSIVSASLMVSTTVALRKESVDRNIQDYDIGVGARKSLSARRAWIEIPKIQPGTSTDQSLSARRAWIEIDHQSHARRSESVALRKESVDRNLMHVLKGSVCFASLSARRAWIEMSKVKTGILFGLASLSARRAWIEIAPRRRV